jgi:hypothetical protein
MTKRGRAAKASRGGTGARKPASAATPPSDDSQVSYSNLSLHELFQQQAAAMLDRADLDEEAKQSILIAMSCPCCGAGGLSFTAKLKRRT